MKLTKCVLCLNSIPSPNIHTDGDGTKTAHAKNNDEINASTTDRANSVFVEFCKCFSINLPSGILSWDLEKELAPICNECQLTANRLIELHDELRKLQKVLQETEKCVRNRIKESQRLLSRCPVEDRRILVVRDLIVGPFVCLENNEVPPIYFCSAAVETKSASDNDDNADYASHFDGNDDTLDFETEQDEQPQQTENVEQAELEGSENAGFTGKDEQLQSDYQVKPEVDLKAEMRTEPEAMMIEIEGEFGDTEIIRRNPPRRRRPKKYNEPAEDSESETDMTFKTFQPPQIGHTVGTEEVKKMDDHDDEEDLDSDDDDDFEDDPDDKDFVLPDDSAQTLNEDSKLESKVRQSLHWHRTKHKPKDSTASADQQISKVPFKLTKLESNRWDYGGHQFVKVSGEFKCCSCDNVKRRELRRMTRHIRDLHLGYFNRQCEVCGKTYTNSLSFFNHRRHAHRPVTEMQPVICEFCGKEFKKVLLLQAHLKRMHISEEGEQKVCEICGKSFKTVSEVNKHKRCVHAKEKRVYCEVCGKGFFSMGRLKKHMFAHSEEKSFECELCGQKLAHYGGLHRHKKLFHPAESSFILPNDTLTTNDAPEAAVRARPEEPAKSVESPDDVMCTLTLKCKLCGLQYNRQNNLTRHLLQIHHINVKGYAWKCKGFKRPNVRVGE